MAQPAQQVQAGIGRLLATNPLDPEAREFVILKPEISVGSDENNDFVIRDATISRFHAIIRFKKTGLELRDMGSTNGTFVNGKRVVDSLPIDKGDEIRFGGASFILLRGGLAAPVPAVSTTPSAPEKPTAPRASRGRGFSVRTIGELTLLAFVIGFGTAQYLAYLLYHEENKLLLAKAVPLPAVQQQHSSSPNVVSSSSDKIESSDLRSTRSIRTGFEERKTGHDSSPAVHSAPLVGYAATSSTPDGTGSISRVVAGAISLARYVPGSGQQAGQESPDFTLPDLQSKSVSLSSFRGKLVFLNFWATWCGACRSEMPSLEALYKNLRNDRFVILTVSVDQQGLTAVQPFLKRNGYNFPVLLDQSNEVSSAYRVQGIPATFIIDGTGRIVWNGAGSLDWSNISLRSAIENLIPFS